MQFLPRKTSLAILSFSGLVLLLGSAKLLRPVDFASVLDFHPRELPVSVAPTLVGRGTAARSTRPTNTAEVGAAETVTGTLNGPATGHVQPPVEEPGNGFAHLNEPPGSLDGFYRALARTQAKQGVTRILHYGDSPVTADSITADARSLLQQQFGDAGQGFVLIAKPWAWYGHRGIEVQGSGWRIEPASQARAKDGIHGLGGVSFRGEAGAASRIRLETAQDQVEVSFLRQPGGGVFGVKAGDAVLGQVNTEGADKQQEWVTFRLPAATQDVSVSVLSGSVRLFGTSFSKDAPGLIYNSLGLNGGQVQVVVRYFEQKQWAADLRHERPDLVVINYGTNESIFPGYIDTYYQGELREVIRRVKVAVPNASLLVMSPMDRGQRDSSGQIATVPILPRIIDIQRQAASDMGCAFFNTFEAMGGAGTMARWYAMQPRLVSADFTHPLPGGARKVGMLLDQALVAGFERFASNHVTPNAARRAAQ